MGYQIKKGRILLLVALTISQTFFATAQQSIGREEIYDIGANFPKFINTPDSTVRLMVSDNIPDGRINPELTYYWFTLNKLHKTKGGCSGKLLNGTYEVFNKNSDLVEQGSFLLGLKHGQWIRWYSNGQTNEVSIWNKGVLEGAYFFYNSSGKLHWRANYQTGKLHGNYTIYKQDTIYSVSRYKNGKLIRSHKLGKKEKGV